MCEERGMGAKVDVDRFVADVRRACAEADAQRAVEEVLARAVAEPGAILAALGEPKEAGIHPLLQSEDLTILNVVWAPLMLLLPHEHAMWASIGVYTGREDNIVWRRKGPRIEADRAEALAAKDVFGLPLDAIHSVTNPIPRLTGAIHIYGGDFFRKPRSEWDPDTLRERPFDLEAARARFRDASARFAGAG
jgi:predicted metal-dependent enzyme (double-stranded beta helix superfamily)